MYVPISFGQALKQLLKVQGVAQIKSTWFPSRSHPWILMSSSITPSTSSGGRCPPSWASLCCACKANHTAAALIYTVVLCLVLSQIELLLLGSFREPYLIGLLKEYSYAGGLPDSVTICPNTLRVFKRFCSLVSFRPTHASKQKTWLCLLSATCFWGMDLKWEACPAGQPGAAHQAPEPFCNQMQNDTHSVADDQAVITLSFSAP